MRTAVLMAFLALTMFSPTAKAAATVPLVAPVQTASSGAAPLQRVQDDGGGTPDGCLFDYFCYGLPSGDGTAEWVRSSGFTYLLVHGVARFLASILPFSDIWLPFALHFTLVDADARPPLEGPLLMGMLITGLGSLAWSVFAVPIMILPLIGWMIYVGGGLFLRYWVAPVTLLHLYNRAIQQNGEEAPRPRKKAKRAPRRRHVEEDDDDEEY